MVGEAGATYSCGFEVCLSASILDEMLAHLFFWRFVGKVAALQTLDGQVGRGQQWTEGRGKHGIGLEGIEGSTQARGEPLNPTLRALCVTEVARVNSHRLAWIELAADAIESCSEEGAHGQIGIPAVVDRFELQVGGLGLTPPEGGGNADGPLPIIKTISGI